MSAGAALAAIGLFTQAGGCGGSGPVTIGPEQDSGTPDATADAPKAVCGDGIVEPGEDCDNGANNGPNTGCENDCTFSCVAGTSKGDPKCSDGNPCNGMETCGSDHICHPGTPEPVGTSCGTGMICSNGMCQPAPCAATASSRRPRSATTAA